MINVVEVTDLNSSNIIDIYIFLDRHKFDKNIVFISPVWIHRMKLYFYINFKYTLFYLNNELIAIHLMFISFKGYVRVSKCSPIFRFTLERILSITHKRQWWKLPVLIKADSTNNTKINIEKILAKLLFKSDKITHSPVNDGCLWECFPSKQYGTFLYDFYKKTYKNVHSDYHRSLKRCLKNFNNNLDLHCEKLNFNDTNMLDKYIKFVLAEQVNSNKKYPISRKILLRERHLFESEKNIFEIFILHGKENILGSIRIYGTNNYVSESQAITSILSVERKINAQYIIKDSVIKFCFKENIRYYDLSGFNPSERRSKKEEGIYRFKRQFGAKELIYSTVSSL